MIQNESAPKTKEEFFNLVTSSAAMYPFDVDMLDHLQFVNMSLKTFRESPFLDQNIVTLDGFRGRVPLNVVSRLLNDYSKNLPEGSAASLECKRYIFHAGHVGSTLISRVLGSFNQVLALREPNLLQWLANYAVYLGEPESRISHDQFLVRLRIAITLLSRKFEETNEVLIKGPSVTNVIAEDILDHTKEARAIFVYTALEPYMATVLKGRWGSGVFRHAPQRLKRLNHLIDGEDFVLHKMNLGEIVAMTWVTEMLTLGKAAGSRADRIAWLDFDLYLDDPSRHLPDLLNHLEISHSSADLERVLSSDIHSKHSKSKRSKDYSVADRVKDIERTLRESKDNIDSGKRWLDAAASAIPQIQNIMPLVSN